MVIEFEMDDATGDDPSSILPLSILLIALGISETATEAETTIAQTAKRYAEAEIIRYLQYNPVMSVRTEYYPNLDLRKPSNAVWEVNDTHAYLRELSGGQFSELQIAGLPIRQTDSSGENAIDLRIDYDGRSGTRSGSFGSDTIKVEGSDFHPNYDFIDSGSRRVCRDGIIRSNGMWPQSPGSVKIVYVAGYTAAELAGTDTVLNASPIQEAALDEAVRRVHKAYSRMKDSKLGFGSGPISMERMGDYTYQTDQKLLKELIGSSSSLLAESMMKLESFVNWGIQIAS